VSQVSDAFVLGPSEGRWDELAREPELDAVTFEIVRHKLQSINEEQGIALKAVSSSPIVTEASDFNNGLYLPGGELVSMGPQVVFHSGAIPIVIRHVVADCADDPGIGEGDMFAVNDPYKGAPHHPDLALVAPIHYGGELVAWAGVAAHQVDVGGMTIGSISVRAREKQQEGLMLPPTKLVEGGVLRDDVWRLILNMTRQPQMVGLDLKGFVASNVVARRRLGELIAEYGVETVTTAMRELVRWSEVRFRERLLELPDGEFRSQGFLDHDGHENRVYRTDIVLTKRADTLRFDFSASSPQAPGFVNCTEAALVGGVFGGLAPLLVRDIPWNHGILNAVEIVAPEGLICNARSPAPCGSGTIAEGWMIVNTVAHVVSKLAALSPAHRRYAQAVTHGTFDALFLGDRNQHGEPYGTQLMDAQLGGGGATAVADGIDQSGGFVTPRPNIPNVEADEMHGPMLYLFRSFFPDSGGAGAFRGGRAAGLAFTPHGVERLRCALTTQGVESPVSRGQFGGYPGVCNRHTVIRDSNVLDLFATSDLPLRLDSVLEPLDLEGLGGVVEHLPAKTDEFALVPGDVLLYTWSGGGGFGDPLDRDDSTIARDVDRRVVLDEHARQAYGHGDDRDELRRARLTRAGAEHAAARPPAGEEAAGEHVVPFGPSLALSRRSARLQVECRCGHVFCDAEEDWKLRAARHSLGERDWPAGVTVHADLELVEYLCPACGTLHAVDVEERGAGPVQDVRLAADAFAASDPS
jgi:N-methylhydantoinase B